MPRELNTSTIAADPREATRTETLVSLGVALTAGQVLVRSTTNDASEVAFAIPPDVTGDLQGVVDAVLPHLVGWVAEGDVVGEVEIAPQANSLAAWALKWQGAADS